MIFVDSSTRYSLISLDTGLCMEARAEDERSFARLSMREWQGILRGASCSFGKRSRTSLVNR